MCSRLIQLDEIGEESIKGFWDEISKKQQELRFTWQRENLCQEAKERFNDLLSGYQYDTKTRVYNRKELLVPDMR